ncbi:MAG TPA: MFS transporter [Gaiellaceae bacterium]|nr:MFS transporter [Gaiellaceae bacterium]
METSDETTEEALWKRLLRGGYGMLEHALGGAERARIILLLAAVLGLSSADASTVGASAGPLRDALHINNTDIGLLVSVTSLVAAVASLPFGMLADRVRRTKTLAIAIAFWSVAMVWSATVSNFQELLLTRLALGAVTAAAGPLVASLVGDYFPSEERGRVYGWVLAGELVGAGVGFAVTGDIAALSWRAAFFILAIPAVVLAVFVWQMPEPKRGGSSHHEPHQATDAQRLARERGIEPDEGLVLDGDPRRMGIIAATRYVLRIRTNVVLIIASACGYYFLAGVQTFGIEFTTHQYGIDQPLASLLLLLVGIGGIVGVLSGGAAGDWLLRRGNVNGRIWVSAITAALACVFFVPPIFARSAVDAVPYLIVATLFLSAQNPPLDAARLDIVVPLVWGRAEAVRTLVRTVAQALAPLVFGGVSDYVFGGGRTGLQWTFVVMVVPLAASAYFLFTGLRTYPRDVAAAAHSLERANAPNEV